MNEIQQTFVSSLLTTFRSRDTPSVDLLFDSCRRGAKIRNKLAASSSIYNNKSRI